MCMCGPSGEPAPPPATLHRQGVHQVRAVRFCQTTALWSAAGKLACVAWQHAARAHRCCTLSPARALPSPHTKHLHAATSPPQTITVVLLAGDPGSALAREVAALPAGTLSSFGSPQVMTDDDCSRHALHAPCAMRPPYDRCNCGNSHATRRKPGPGNMRLAWSSMEQRQEVRGEGAPRVSQLPATPQPRRLQCLAVVMPLALSGFYVVHKTT